MQKTCSILLLLLAITGLDGCVRMLTPIGEENFDCNRRENPDSPYCHSFRAADDSTSGTIPDSRFDEKSSIEEFDQLTGIAPVDKGSVKTGSADTRGEASAKAGQSTPSSGAPLKDGSPVRVGPLVQRVWIKRFVDANDMMVSDLVVYKEVQRTHWVGEPLPSPSGVGRSGAYPHRVPETTRAAKPAPAPEGEKNDFNFAQPGSTPSGRPPSGNSDGAMPE